MPRIIKSSGVNIDRARPIVMGLMGREDGDARILTPLPSALPQMEQIYASAEMIVEEIISKARNDADNMLVDARQETINVLQDAVREGWDQGMNEALRAMREMQALAQLEIEAAVDSLKNDRRQMIKEVEHDVLELVFDIVDKVLSLEMDRSEEWIASMVRTAIGQMEGDESVIMKVAARTREKVAAAASGMLAAAGKQPSRFSVVVEAALPPGGCAIETARGVIDTSVENKFDKLKTALRENA